MDELDIDLFIEILSEQEKGESLDRVRLKKLEKLRDELLELLKIKDDIEHFETMKAADLRIYRALEKLSM